MLFQAPFTSDQIGTLPLDAQLFLLFGVKILFIVGALIYLVLSFVIVRQIHVMRSTVITPFSNAIAALGYVHLLFAFGVLLLFIFGL